MHNIEIKANRSLRFSDTRRFYFFAEINAIAAKLRRIHTKRNVGLAVWVCVQTNQLVILVHINLWRKDAWKVKSEPKSGVARGDERTKITNREEDNDI